MLLVAAKAAAGGVLHHAINAAKSDALIPFHLWAGRRLRGGSSANRCPGSQAGAFFDPAPRLSRPSPARAARFGGGKYTRPPTA